MSTASAVLGVRASKAAPPRSTLTVTRSLCLKYVAAWPMCACGLCSVTALDLVAYVCLCCCCCVWHPQIRQALSALEAGNTFAFATGKAARQKEKELAAQFREGLKTGSSNVVETGGGATLKVRPA